MVSIHPSIAIISVIAGVLSITLSLYTWRLRVLERKKTKADEKGALPQQEPSSKKEVVATTTAATPPPATSAPPAVAVPAGADTQFPMAHTAKEQRGEVNDSFSISV
jgi:hypothetical protein